MRHLRSRALTSLIVALPLTACGGGDSTSSNGSGASGGSTAGGAAGASTGGSQTGGGAGAGGGGAGGSAGSSGSGGVGGSAKAEPDTDIGDQGHEVWIYMQSHLHTTGFHACANDPTNPGTGPESACYSSEGITAFLDEALSRGASDMIITDHNNIEAWFDPAFVPRADSSMSRYATPLRGSEWSSKDGHMTLLFPDEAASSNAEALTNGWIFADGNDTSVSGDSDYIDTIDSVHSAGGIAIINHPELAIHVFPENGLDADGVEIGIPPNPLDDIGGGSVSFHASAEARRFWQRRLISGDRMTGSAGADHHHGGGDIPGLEAPTFGIAVNYVRIDPTLPNFSGVAEALASPETTIDQRSAIIIDAVRRGHVMVVEDENNARVYVGADTDGDGRYHDARAGDCVLPADFSGSEVEVRVRIVNPSSAFGSTHYNLEIWTAGSDDTPLSSIEVDYDDGFPSSPDYRVDPEDPFSIYLTVPYDAAAAGFIRFVLERDIVLSPVDDTEVVTNPIYLGDWGSQCAAAKPLF